MCNPAVAIAMTVLSTGASVYSQQQQQEAANAQAEHQAAVDRARADAERANAEHSLENSRRAHTAAVATDEESKKAQMAYVRRLKSTQDRTRQDFAARGVFVNEGVALDEVDLQQKLGRQDIRTIQSEFERKAFGFQQQSEDLVHQAENQLKGAHQFDLNSAFNTSLSNSSNPMAIAASLTAGIGTGIGQYNSAQQLGYFGGPKT